MKRGSSFTLACLAAALPWGGGLALADQVGPAATASNAPACPSAPACSQDTPSLISMGLPGIGGEAPDLLDTAGPESGVAHKAWRGDQIRFSSESGNLVARPWVLAKGDLAEWDGRHVNPNYMVEFGLKGSWYQDVTFDFAGFIGYETGLTWREANVGYRGCEIFGQRMYYQAGLYDSIYWKEQGKVYDGNTLFLYRSLTNYTVGSAEYGELVGGAAAFWGDPCGDEPFSLGLSVHEIANTQPFMPDLINGTTDLGARHIGTALRVDWTPTGDRYMTHDLTGRVGRRNMLDVGGGIAYDDLGNANLVRTTIDAQYTAPRQFTVFGALALNYTDFSSAVNGAGSRTDWGVLLQGGYFFTPQLEGIARYDFTHIDDAFRVSGKSHLQEFSIGLNFYPGPAEWRNHVKLQAALNWLPDGSPAIQEINYTGLVPGNSRVFLQFGAQFMF